MASRTHSTRFQPSLRWRFAVAALVAGAFLAIDRVTKLAIQGSLSPAPFTGDTFEAPLLPGVMKLLYVENRGAAFSLGEGSGWLFVLLAIAVSLATLVYLWRAPGLSKLEVVGLGMVVGGAIGNAIDRILFGYVIDFLATEFIDFPVFNIADIGITCGVFIAFLGFAFLSPANKLDATAELDRRRAEDAARRKGV
ncbi:MAG: signal peptidase II [Collinsella sp.]|nr:signal peptidase II [Collinsella sp.]